MYQTFRPFRLQPPVAVSRFRSDFDPELTARSADRIPCGDLGVVWVSPLPRRLTTTTGRNEFVILRTSRSPPVALHPLSRGRSYFRLQSSDPTLTGTCTLLIQHHHKRTRPGNRTPAPTPNRTCKFPSIRLSRWFCTHVKSLRWTSSMFIRKPPNVTNTSVVHHESSCTPSPCERC